jgi:hypothetical protein
MPEEQIKEKTKIWKTVSTFQTFEEADNKRKELLTTNEQVKVRRGGLNGDLFRVKIWNTPKQPVKNNKRKNEKNANKKVRD